MSFQNESNENSIVYDFFILFNSIRVRILEKKKLILLIGIFGFFIGFAYAFLKKPIYNAELTFASENESGSQIPAYLGIASQLGFDLGNSQSGVFSGNSLMVLIKSRVLLQKTFLTEVDNGENKILLINYFIQSGLYDKNWKKNSFLANVKYDKNWAPGIREKDSLLKSIINDFSDNLLSVNKKDKSIDIVTISFKHSDEGFAKLFVEKLVENTINYYVDYKTSKSKKNVEILSNQVDSVRSELKNYITSVSNSVDNINLNQLSSIKTKSSNDYKKIDIQASTLIYAELLKNLELSKISLRKEIPFIQIIDPPILPLENVNISKYLMGFIFFTIALLTTIVIVAVQKLKFKY